MVIRRHKTPAMAWNAFMHPFHQKVKVIEEEFSTVTLDQVTFTFLIFTVGIVIAVFILIAEIIRVSDAVWLIFSKSENMFENWNIPIDCELLIAIQNVNGTFLQEVYRLSPSHPLQFHNFCIPNFHKNISCTVRSLYQRRLNLKGLALKTGILTQVIWLILLLIIIMSEITMLLMNTIWSCRTHANIKNEVLESILFPIGAFCYQGEDTYSSINYARVLNFTVNLTALVTFTCYSAFLISYLSVKRNVLPFRNLQEFLDDGTYTLGVPRDNALYTLFKVNLKVKVIEEEFSPVSLDQVTFTFLILTVGIVIAVFILIAEIVSHHCANLLKSKRKCEHIPVSVLKP
ncbi:hypothetical protein L9F63_019821 [Diploptera punctata]|uniref:Ionotropic glutamate receptor C-terminal domain-containing protein n=1 Tax=Diploptera punctata TaxID=6984 RepID=A0AAD7ZTF2_DIPPU|nr:hypothetical protein L9F63_019821 [Diploptera punctata]